LDHFVDIGFGPSGAWPGVDSGAFAAGSMVQNRERETQLGILGDRDRALLAALALYALPRSSTGHAE
jgi:hypothetical protein